MRRPSALRSSERAARAHVLKSVLSYATVVSIASIGVLAGACGDDTESKTSGGSGGASNSSGGQGGEGLGDFVTSAASTSATGASSSSSGGGVTCKAPDPNGGATTLAQRYGDAAAQSGGSVFVDKAGNILLAGAFEGSIDFGGGALNSAGKADMYIAKLNPQGQLLWSKRFGDGYNQSATGIAADADGNVIVTGIFIGTVDFGVGPLTSDTIFFQDVFIAKFNPDGAATWSKKFGDKNIQYSRSVAVDPIGNIVIAGYFQNDVDFGGGVLSSAGGSTFDGFVAKFNSGGQHQWSKRFGDLTDQAARQVVVDGAGSVYVAGEAAGSVDFGAGPVPALGGPSAFVAKLDAQGVSQWTKVSVGAPMSKASAHGVAVSPSGNVAVVGSFQGDFDFGGGKFMNFDLDDIFVTILGADGSHKSTKRYGDPELQQAEGVVFAPNGDVIIGGGFTGQVDFGGGPVTSLGGFDGFLARLDATGCATWRRTYGGPTVQTIQTIALDAVGGRVLVTGTFNGDTDFGLGTLTAAGDDAFVLGVKQ